MTRLYSNVQHALETNQFNRVLNLDHLARTNINSTSELNNLIDYILLNSSLVDREELCDLIKSYSYDLLLAVIRSRRFLNV